MFQMEDAAISNPAQNSSMQPSSAAWGSIAWSKLHVAGLAFGKLSTLNQLGRTRSFLAGEFRGAIACGDCRGKFDQFCRSYQFALGVDFFVWGWALHEEVNRALGKPSVPLETARAFWTTHLTPGELPGAK
jgi:hypothetical protein